MGRLEVFLSCEMLADAQPEFMGCSAKLSNTDNALQVRVAGACPASFGLSCSEEP